MTDKEILENTSNQRASYFGLLIGLIENKSINIPYVAKKTLIGHIKDIIKDSPTPLDKLYIDRISSIDNGIETDILIKKVMKNDTGSL